jgi:hypothetical protein
VSCSCHVSQVGSIERQLTAGEISVLRAVERRAEQGGWRRRREHYRWAEAAWLWAARIKRPTRPWL